MRKGPAPFSSNQLDHTLVGAGGSIVSSERRTNNDSYNVYAEDPFKGAQGVVAGPGPTTASPNGWLVVGATQKTINIVGNNASSYLDAKPNNAPDIGGGRRRGRELRCIARSTRRTNDDW